MKKRKDQFPNLEVKSQKVIDGEMIELFQKNYGTIETTASCKYYFQGKRNTFKGFADSDEELVKKITEWLVNSEHVAREDTVRKTIDGEVLTGTRCVCCNHEFVEDEGCYRINEDGDYLCQSCHDKEFPAQRSWFEYMLQDYEMETEDGEEVICTKEELSKRSDDEIEEWCAWLAESENCVAYYTTAE
ncbi:hypothetical protein N8C49_00840 (plasmid) [Enterococcus faecium]